MNPRFKSYDPSSFPNSQEEQDTQRALQIVHGTSPLERLPWIEQCLILFAEQVVADKKRRGLQREDYVWDPACFDVDLSPK